VSTGMLGSAIAQDSLQLGLARVFTGVGIGAMLPSINTMVAEYSSLQRRELSLSIMSTGYPIGAVLGGIAAILVSARFGWRGIFVFGGAMSTAMIPLVLWRLPESLDFLLTRRPAGALEAANRVLRLLGRPELSVLPEVARSERKTSARDILSGGLARPTLLLWA